MAVISDGLYQIPPYRAARGGKRSSPHVDRVSELSEVVSVGGFVGGLTLFRCHVNDLRVKGPPSIPLPHAHSHTLHLKQSCLVLKAPGSNAKKKTVRIPERVLKFVPVRWEEKDVISLQVRRNGDVSQLPVITTSGGKGRKIRSGS